MTMCRPGIIETETGIADVTDDLVRSARASAVQPITFKVRAHHDALDGDDDDPTRQHHLKSLAVRYGKGPDTSPCASTRTVCGDERVYDTSRISAALGSPTPGRDPMRPWRSMSCNRPPRLHLGVRLSLA